MKIRYFASLLLTVLLMGCSSAPSNNQESHGNDPFEGVNRQMWSFNYDVLDPYIVRPASLAYGYIVPSFARKGIANILANLEEPASVVNNILMGNGELALLHFNRFWVNTTFGIGGVMDVASQGGLAKEEERVFSDVVGHYGVGNGWYFMIPGYGPTTTREVTDLVDSSYPVLSFLNIWASAGKWVLEGMETRLTLIEQEALLENSPDSYSFMRDVYLQRRDYRAEVTGDEQVDLEAEDELDAYLDELD